jgi:hypothetical protein
MAESFLAKWSRVIAVRFCPQCKLQAAEALAIDCQCEFADKERHRAAQHAEQRG